MTPVFVDTVGLLAVWDEDDQWHTPAEAAWNQLAQGRVRLITTSYVLLECGNAVARMPFRADVEEMRRRLERAGALIHPTESDWAEAWQHYARNEIASAGIVDHVSFVVMRRMGVSDAFTNDRHFQAAGFNSLF
jgi:uncharacterized protein